MRVLIAGGGTGGHVIPALAIARELRDQHKAEVRFVGTARGLETKLVPEAGFNLDVMSVGQLKNVSVITRATTMIGLPFGLLHCFGLLTSFRPQAVVGVGGYASGPTMLAAILSGIPTIAFEPNAAPGLANRMVGEFVTAAAINFEQSAKHFHTAEVTGIPVRREFFAVAPKLRGDGRLLVFGGSQGARVLNDAMPEVARRLLERYPELTIVHQAGGRNGESTQRAFEAAGVRSGGRVRVVPYLDNMVAEISAADVVLCRSGASTVAELAAAGRPSVLVPFAAAADDHQRKNAEVLVEAGAARMIEERALDPQTLFATICTLFDDPLLRLRMGTAARSLAHADAAGRIADMCVRLQKVKKSKKA